MALQVWLPLNKNGNLKNQGLADVTVTNNGATYNTSGKIGGCYNIGNNKYITSILDINSSPISASCWIYLNSFQGSWDYIISLNNNGGYADQCIAIALESTTKIVFCVGGNSSCLYNNSETLVGKWTHLAVTFDGSKIKGYLNGVEVCSYNSTASLKRSNLTIGCRNGNTSYYTDCKINDVRIYDHCLSPKEVKEISKGLVIHYPLDDGNVTNIAYDCSGYCNNGTVSGTLTTSIDTPRYDKCSQGNGNISCSGLTINNPFTISTWIYLPITETTGSGNELTIGPVNLYKDHDGVDKHTFSITKSDNSTTYLTTFYPPEDKWYHLAIVSNGSTLKIYKNGVASTYSISTKDGKTNFSIMLSNNIKLSDLRLYATALSEDDVKELYNTSAFVDNHGNVECFQAYEDSDSQVMKTGLVKTGEFVENYDYLYLPAGVWVNTGLQYTAGSTFSMETYMRYATGGSGRDLMGWSAAAADYWGVRANGTWENATGSNSDITQYNKVTYNYTVTSNGTYTVGNIRSGSYSTRNKYIYRVKLYKNGILERDLYPCKGADKNGLVDVLTGTFYPANSTTATLGNDSETRITKVYDKYIECNQLIEI